jgi:hypothetical protein
MKNKNSNQNNHNTPNNNLELEYDFLDIHLSKIEQDYKNTSLYLELNKEYYDKYKITHLDVIKKRYNDAPELLNFYNQYFTELEKIEKIGMLIWKLFGDLWVDEKQSLILQILSLTLLIEKQVLRLKKSILNLTKAKSKSKNPGDIKFKSDKSYFFNLISINKDYYIKNIEFVDIKSSFNDLEQIQLKKREESKRELKKEFDRIYSETITITSN